MKQIVLDTNVLISGLISPSNPPGRILDAVRTEALQLVADDRVIAEYRTVLRRPYFAKYLTAAEVEWITDFLGYACRQIVCEVHFVNLPDPKDACFLEVAHSAGVPLVTGNIKHFPSSKRRDVAVYSPRDYLENKLYPK